MKGEFICSVSGSGTPADPILPALPRGDENYGNTTSLAHNADYLLAPGTMIIYITGEPEQYFIDLGGDCLWYDEENAP